MNSKATSIISCFGLPGLLIAGIIYFSQDDKSSRYYIIQSLNAVLCGFAAVLASGLISSVIGGFIATICGWTVSLYSFILFVQILISAINQTKTEIFGLVKMIL